MKKNGKRFFMKLYLVCFLVSIVFVSDVFANITDEEEELKTVNLVFTDRVLKLNFENQSGLLQETPLHFVYLFGKKMPLDLEGDLPLDNSFFDIRTESTTQINSENLKKYFIESSILREEKESAVKIGFENNFVKFEGTPRDGFKVDFERLNGILNEAIIRGKENVRTPAQKVYSKIEVDSELEKRGIKEVLAVGESNFTGSSRARRININAASNKFNGYIIEKGKTFSFNTILGSVDPKYGFVEELVILGNETKKELGGGTCQVSTTVFRAAFNGGFPIKSRRNHSYAVPYYKPYGLDATIYLGGQDFVFKNDTPGDILIQTFFEGDNLFFVFYGTNDGRETRIQGPFISNYRTPPTPIYSDTTNLKVGETKMVSPSHTGFRSEWVREIMKDGKRVEKENLVSVYRPWPARYLRGVEKKTGYSLLDNLQLEYRKPDATLTPNLEGSGLKED